MSKLASMTITALLFLSGFPASAQVLSTGQAVLLDANGLVVGPVVEHLFNNLGGGLSETLEVSILVDGRPTFLQASTSNRNRLLSPRTNSVPTPVIFESNDCSGQPFYEFNPVSVNVPFSQRSFATNSPGLSIWIPDPNGSGTSITYQSFLTSDGVCDSSSNGSEMVRPAIEITTPFVGPYSLGSVPMPIASPASVPAVSPLGLAILAIFLVAAAAWVLRRGTLGEHRA